MFKIVPPIAMLGWNQMASSKTLNLACSLMDSVFAEWCHRQNSSRTEDMMVCLGVCSPWLSGISLIMEKKTKTLTFSVQSTENYAKG